MRWQTSWRADQDARVIADRHYNRQKVGAKQFAPPGRCVVLVIPLEAFWITSWPFSRYVKHAWAGAWVCSAFRNERPDLHLSSSLITEALAATLAAFRTDETQYRARNGYPDDWSGPVAPDYWSPPPLGMITFVDRDKTRPKRDPGRCYLKAGFHVSGTRPCCADKPSETEAGLVALHMTPADMPPPCEALPENFYEIVRGVK